MYGLLRLNMRKKICSNPRPPTISQTAGYFSELMRASAGVGFLNSRSYKFETSIHGGCLAEPTQVGVDVPIFVPRRDHGWKWAKSTALE